MNLTARTPPTNPHPFLSLLESFVSGLFGSPSQTEQMTNSRFNVTNVPRAFKSSNDPPAPVWYAWIDNAHRISCTLLCRCGIEFPILPDPHGIYKWKHKFCFRGTLKLEDYETLFESKEERKKRKARDESKDLTTPSCSF